MPINPNALASPDPEPQVEQTTVDQQIAEVQTEQPKRAKRTNKQMLEDAVIPGDAELVKLKDVNTGFKVEKTWREAVDMVATGAMEFVDKSLKWAVKKEEQQRDAEILKTNQVADPLPVATENIEQPQPATGDIVPPEGAVGDEVRMGSATYYIAHGHQLTSSAPYDESGKVIPPKRRWQRELGAGVKGPWESTVLTQTSEPRPIFEKPEPQQTAEEPSVRHDYGAFTPTVEANGNGTPPEVTVETQRLPHTEEEIAPGVIKIGAGILEKIGLPNYSSVQVGPLTISRQVIDDGRRHKEMVNGREVEVITAAVEGFELIDATVEVIAARFRGQLQPFLQSQNHIHSQGQSQGSYS